jgi:hypothetical protein
MKQIESGATALNQRCENRNTSIPFFKCMEQLENSGKCGAVFKHVSFPVQYFTVTFIIPINTE